MTMVGGSERRGSDRSQEIYRGRIPILCGHEYVAQDSDLVSEHETQETHVKNKTHIEQTHKYLYTHLSIWIQKSSSAILPWVF